MLTDWNVVDNLYTILNTTEINSAIDGRIYKYVRPLTSDKTDIVINTLPIQEPEPQRCLANINIYKKLIESTGTLNSIDLDKIARLIIDELENIETNNLFQIDIVSVNTMIDLDRKDTSLKNIRIELYGIEEEKKNE